jgi:hypothetical protein
LESFVGHTADMFSPAGVVMLQTSCSVLLLAAVSTINAASKFRINSQWNTHTYLFSLDFRQISKYGRVRVLKFVLLPKIRFF